ncbi:MAG: hypothetical protein VX908_00345 [Planctomycetota bacterium]|nr:hypothetical protein [Planctomycetota bacterium]
MNGEDRSHGFLGRFGREVNRSLRDRLQLLEEHTAMVPLLERLRSQHGLRGFLDTWAEVRVAAKLIEAGCVIDVEVPTPSGRSCDLAVHLRGHDCYVHVKRLANEETSARRLGISSRLRFLERIKRPFIVRIRWEESLSEQRMQELVERAASFIKHAHIGDELTVRGESGEELGGVRIVAPWEGTHVSLVIGLPDGFIDEVPRIRRLLSRAHRQFMPRATNIIVIASAGINDATDVETALLGSHEERWDVHPARGRRIAYGRADDGFWSGKGRPESLACSWCQVDLESEEMPRQLFLREPGTLASSLESLLEELLGRNETTGSSTPMHPGDDAGSGA